MIPAPTIINRGRGPEIAGTRITVFDIMDYYKHDWHPDLIAVTLRLSSDQVRTAIRYIEEHKPEVLADYQKILDRVARGNPPEVRAKQEESHRKFRERCRELGIKTLEERNGDARVDG